MDLAGEGIQIARNMISMQEELQRWKNKHKNSSQANRWRVVRKHKGFIVVLDIWALSLIFKPTPTPAEWESTLICVGYNLPHHNSKETETS